MSIDRVFADSTRFRLCFVCTGNICRSPMAEAVVRRLAGERGIGDRLLVSSAAIGDYHVGETADRRTVEVLEQHGFSASDHRAKQFKARWFDIVDLVIACDRGQERVLRSMAKNDGQRAKIRLLREFDPEADSLDIPDPYYSDPAFFEHVLRQVEAACTRLVQQITPALLPRQGTNTSPITTIEDQQS